MDDLIKYILEQTSKGRLDKMMAVEMVTMLKQGEARVKDDIAIIGISVRLPMAGDIEQFWSNIENKVNSIVEFPESRREDVRRYAKHKDPGIGDITFIKGSYLDEVDKFDREFFKLTPKEASLMSPDQRLMLETAWEAVEDAGYGGSKLSGTKTGVYIGYYSNVRDNYSNIIYDVEPESISMSITGNVTAVLAGRLSYMMNLKGPSLVLDTACSSSLVAVHTACKSIMSGECEMAIAGGVKINTLPVYNKYEDFGIESTDGETRTFDDQSDGAGVGEGVVALLLKPLSKALRDRDHVYAVIKGTAANQDGMSIGITAPNSAAQSDAIAQAWQDAGIHPESIGYIEAHGTATELGDPIEIKGITNAFERFTSKKQFCAIGTVKTNIGHLYECAGITGLLKAVMALRKRKLPPSLHFGKPNRNIQFEHTPVYVNTRVREWELESGPRRCGVSAFGMSGTNCHVVLEQAPDAASGVSQDGGKMGPQALVLSAVSEAALLRLRERYAKRLEEPGDLTLEDLCYTAATGRGHYRYRWACVTDSLQELREKLLQALGETESVYVSKLSAWSGQEKDEGSTAALVRVASGLLTSLSSAEGAERRQGLNELCRQYAGGASVDWELLYAGRTPRRVSLPVYPFERTRCWVDIQDVEAEPAAKGEDIYFHALRWEPDRPRSEDRLPDKPGTILVFADRAGLADTFAGKLRDVGHAVHVAKFGDAYIKLGEYEYVYDPADPASYESLLAEFKEQGLSEIIHMTTLVAEHEVGTDEELERSKSTAFYSFARIVKAILVHGFGDEIRMNLVTEHACDVTGKETKLAPHNALLLGLGKVVMQEYPQLQCRLMDFDGDIDLDAVMSERGIRGRSYAVAFRNGTRYTEVFGEVNLEHYERQPTELIEGGVYVITGGTSGIGMETAKRFAGKRVKLVLIGRTDIPDREHWDDIVRLDSESRVAGKIAGIREMEAAGSEVLYCKADVSSREEMEAALASIRTRFGPVNGIVHGAGIPGDGFLYRKTEEQLETILGPKVNGVWLLDQLTAHDPLDFFLIFSSGITVIGEVGQADYTAANCYLDAFAAYRSRKGKKTLAIDWVSWLETGMSVDFGINKDGMFKTIPTAKGLTALEQLLERNVSRMFVGAMNYGSEHLAALGKFFFRLSDKLEAGVRCSLEAADAKRPSSAQRQKQRHIGAVDLAGKQGEAYSEAERQIAQIFNEVLGYKEINIYDNFFDLGGNSIMLIRMHERLEELFPGIVKVAHLFAYTSVHKLAAHISSKLGRATGDADRPAEERHFTKSAFEDIAIIGLAAEMPMAADAQMFWSNIVNGVDSVTAFPEGRKRDMDRYHGWMNARLGSDVPIRYHAGAYLEAINGFDYKFFRLSPKEASLMDPIQRLFMKTAWHAIEDAGYGGRIEGTDTGVYMGFASSLKDSYLKMVCDIDDMLYPVSIVSNITAMMPTRVSYLLNLKGPTMVIDTACSATLVATHTACKAIQNGDCGMALVAGARISLSPIEREHYNVGIESSDGRTRAFDQDADGSGLGEGAAALLLKPLSRAVADNDNIYAVIKGSAINQDGASIGITAPNPEAQTEVILKAWRDAGIDPETLGYIEAHGTATKLGDPIELEGLSNAFREYTDKQQFCAIGSLKSNIGHLYEAAGAGSMVKAAMSLRNRTLPPSIHFERPNPSIGLPNSPIYVNTLRRPWERGETPLRCGVSAFGFSGTNCHVVLEEAPVPEQSSTRCGLEVLTISAKSARSLERLVDRYRKFLQEAAYDLPLRNVCYTANTGRWSYSHRLAVIATNRDELLRKLDLVAEMPLAEAGTVDGCYYGEHRIVPENEARIASDVSERQRLEWGSEANGLMQSAAGEAVSRELLSAACVLYVKGAFVDWALIYEGERINKISLPLYPYDESRCWVELPQAAEIPDTGAATASETFFSMVWRERPLADKEPNPAVSGAVMIVSDGGDLAESLGSIWEGDGRRVVRVRTTCCDAPYDPRFIDVDGSEDGYRRLFCEIDWRSISQIVYIPEIAPPAARDEMELEQQLEGGVYGLFRLLKAVLPQYAEQELEVVLIGSHANSVSGRESELWPHHAAMYGLGKVVGKENPLVTCRCLDIDGTTGAETIAAELARRTGCYEVAFREHKRYVQLFSETAVETAADRSVPIRAGGVYVITGGAGGIGLETAAYLASRRPVRLALINRTPMAARERWGEIISEGKDTKAIRAITRVLELEAGGSEVRFYSADVSSRTELEPVIRDIRQRFGRIEGIVHGAGVGGIEFIAGRDRQSFDQVFRPKVQGTWLLDELTKGDEPDFFVMYSSIASIFSAPGQGDYIAANSYLDAYSPYRNGQGKRTLTVNWSTWREIGMSVDHGFAIDTLYKAIDTDQAIKGLDRALNGSVERVLIGSIHYGSRLIHLLDKFSFELSDRISADLRRVLAATQRKRAAAGLAEAERHAREVTLTGKEDGAYEALELELASICRDVLGFDEIDIHDSFFEMGADSILLMRLHAIIDARYPGVIKVTDMFTNSNLAKLAHFMNGGGKRDSNSDNELSRMLEQMEQGKLTTAEVLDGLIKL